MPDVTVRKDIVVRFITDMQKARKDAKLYENQVSRVGAVSSTAGKATKGMGLSSGLAMSGMAGAALTTVAPIAAVGAGLVVLKKTFDNVLEAGKEAEDALTTLGVMFKSEAKGMEVYQKALERSVVTPYDPRDIVAASVQAQGYIGKAGDVFTKGLYGMKSDAMTVIADMAAFSGQSAVEAATALFRADLQLLDKYGADARRVYAEAKKKGAVGTQAFVAEFVRGMSEIDTWMGMSEKRSQTMSGIISTIKGNFGLIFTYLSGATSTQVTLWTKLKSMIKGFSDAFGEFVKQAKPYLEELGAFVGDIFAEWKELIVELWGVIFPILKAWFGAIFTYGKILWIVILKPMVKIITFGLKLLKTFFGFLFNIDSAGGKIKSIMSWVEKFTSHMDIVFSLTDKLFSNMLATFDQWLKDFDKGLDAIFLKAAKIFGLAPEVVEAKGTEKEVDEVKRFRELRKKVGTEKARKQIIKERGNDQSFNSPVLPLNRGGGSVKYDNRQYANDRSQRNSHNVIYNYNYFTDSNIQDVLDQSGIAG
jgi:hypothetical protein